jgi:hypothetical protein
MPRLKSGELAPSVQALTAAKRRSVEGRISALAAALDATEPPSAQLIDRFRTLDSIAQWKDTAADIAPMSVNTLKAHINSVYPGGLFEFQRARQRLLSLAEPPAPSGGLQGQLRRLRAEHQILMNSVITFSAQYLDLLRRAQDLSKTHRFLQTELRSHARLFPNAHMRLQLIRKG